MKKGFVILIYTQIYFKILALERQTPKQYTVEEKVKKENMNRVPTFG